jgi:hypothetical protein
MLRRLWIHVCQVDYFTTLKFDASYWGKHLRNMARHGDAEEQRVLNEDIWSTGKTSRRMTGESPCQQRECLLTPFLVDIDTCNLRLPYRLTSLIRAVYVHPSTHISAYRQVYPPSTTISAPVVYVLASLARYKYAAFNSLGSASRPSGVSLNHSSFISNGTPPEIAVSM